MSLGITYDDEMIQILNLGLQWPQNMQIVIVNVVYFIDVSKHLARLSFKNHRWENPDVLPPN